MTFALETAEHPENLRRVAIDPLSRVEGHGKVTLLLDADDRVQQVRLHIVEFRGFEKFIQGRPYWEVPVMVQRLCGICPVSHHLAASKALDMIVGAQITPTAEKIRRLMHYGQILQSHALHFFHLASPDLLFGFDSEIGRRNIVAVAAAHPEIARQGVLLRKYGQEVIRHTAGKRIHGTGSVPGGVNKALAAEERTELLADIYQVIGWARGAVELVRKLHLAQPELYEGFGSFRSNMLSIVGPNGVMDLYDGKLRARDADGKLIFDNFDTNRYWDVITEEVRSWSYMKFPYLKALGPEEGWYKVGPLARVQNCDLMDTPFADAARREFLAHGHGAPIHATLAYHWARMIEMLFAAEKIKELLHDDDIVGTDLVTSGERAERGIGVIEAPRGTLIHHYRVNEDDQIVRANLIVATTHNNQAMNESIRQVALRHLDGRKITEPLLNKIEVAIRAFDPCLSCATHALGRMPLVVELVDASGTTVDRLHRDARGGAVLTLDAAPGVAPTLVLAVGNPSRGDDALGPLAAERIEAMQIDGVEVLVDFQLQVEHSLHLAGRDRVLFVDASASLEAPFSLDTMEPRCDASFTSHALAPSAVLFNYQQLIGSPPPAWVLAIRGESFELGEGLSAPATRALEGALVAVRRRLAQPVLRALSCTRCGDAGLGGSLTRLTAARRALARSTEPAATMDAVPPSTGSPLDRFMPVWDVRERFELEVDAPADLVLRTACEFDMQSLPLVKAVFRLREVLMGAAPAAPRQPQGILGETQALGWGLLAAESGRWIACGARCQPWLANVRFTAIPPDDFFAYAEPDQLKIAWTIEAQPLGPTRSLLVQETRAVATDAQARARFRRYWRWARFGIVAIRLLMLPAIQRTAERRWALERPPR